MCGVQRRHQHERVLDVLGDLLLGSPRCPRSRTPGSCVQASVSRSTECSKLKIITGLNTFSSKLPCEPAMPTARVVADHLHAHHRHRLALRRVDLARHDRRARARSPAARARRARSAARTRASGCRWRSSSATRRASSARRSRTPARRAPRAPRTCSAPTTNGRPVSSAIFGRDRVGERRGALLSPVPTAVPPSASS